MSILGDRDRMLAQSQRMAHVGSWELDLDDLADVNSNRLRWSDECYRIFGYEPGTVAVTNELFFQAVHPDDRAAISAAVAKALHENRPYEIENRIIRADGVERIVYQWADIAKDASGRPLRMLGTCQDVTERHRAEVELRESEARFRQLADNLPEGFIYQIIESRERGIRFSYVSRGVETLLGVTPAEALANPRILYGLILDEERPRVLALQEQCARNRTSFDCQLRIQARGGAIRWLHCRSRPRPLSAVETVWDGLALDITARKLDQEAIGRLNDQAGRPCSRIANHPGDRSRGHLGRARSGLPNHHQQSHPCRNGEHAAGREHLQDAARRGSCPLPHFQERRRGCLRATADATGCPRWDSR